MKKNHVADFLRPDCTGEVAFVVLPHIKNIRTMGKFRGAIVVNTDRCKGCSLCVEACPKDVIALARKKVNVHGYPFAEVVSPDDCIGCASCGIVCPTDV